MKTPRFWYPAQAAPIDTVLSGLLLPLSGLFSLAARLRRSRAKAYHARVPVLCVGNAVAGGAGKTPTCLALAQLLKDSGEKPVFVTRGYGGRGEVVCVDPSRHSAAMVGDEALLLAAHAPTWVGADRVAAMRQAESHGTCIIMDDGLQNPHVAPTAAVVVIDGEVGIGNGRIIPAGPLREPLAAAVARAKAVIIIGEDRQALAPMLIKDMKVPVFGARLAPLLPSSFPRGGRFIAFAGIARPSKFYATAQALGCNLIEAFDFADHHPYSADDLDALRLRAETVGARLLTTEKDAVRLPPAARAEVVVLPVALVFTDAAAPSALISLLLNRR